MKINMSKKTIGLLMVSLLLVLSIGVGSALAYFTTYTVASGSQKLELNFSKTDINETVEPGKKVLWVENAESADCFVRVKVIVAEQFQDKLQFAEPDNAGKWTPGDDGYYYYDEVLASGEKTSELIVLLTDISSIATDDFNVIVIQESTPVLYDENGEPDFNWSVKAETVVPVE